jgi:hypothetical protein
MRAVRTIRLETVETPLVPVKVAVTRGVPSVRVLGLRNRSIWL